MKLTQVSLGKFILSQKLQSFVFKQLEYRLNNRLRFELYDDPTHQIRQTLARLRLH
jgi:hypothetical protein